MQKFLLLIMSLLISPCFVQSQNLLKPTWKFAKGDNMQFSKPSFDDQSWSTIEHDKIWEQQGHEGYDGFAWYRQEIFIPKKLKKVTKEHKGFVVYLGKVDDVDETYWNGTLIGATGSMPPEYSGEYATPRKYKIPLESIKFGEINVIAVRAYDFTGGGGLYGNDFYIGPPGMKDLLLVHWAGETNDRILKNSVNQELPFTIENKNKEKVNGSFALKVFDAFGTLKETFQKDLRIKKFSKANLSFNNIDLEPGFYPSELVVMNGEEVLKKKMTIGVSPTAIVSPADRPENFDTYWARAKTELAAVDPQFKLTRMDAESNEKVEVFLLEMRSLGNVLVRGFYCRPKAKGSYPALLSVQGYGTSKTAGNLYKEADMISLVLNIRGHGNSQDNINPGFPGYILEQIEDPEMYIYRGAYMDCIRAVDFLFQQEEVDKDRVAVEGGSQGGALSFATAALDHERIMACAPDVPFLSDFKDYFKIAPWPTGEFVQYLKDHPDFSEEEMYKTLSYIDIKNLAYRIKAPLFMGIGMKDNVCPPHINFAAYNEVTSPKSYVAYPDAGHGLPSEHYALKLKWIKKQFELKK